jgi:hypothetical protein
LLKTVNMKKICITVAVVFMAAIVISCKKEDITAKPTTTTNTKTTTQGSYTTPDGFPFRVSNMFTPTGFYAGGEGGGGAGGVVGLVYPSDSLWASSDASFTVSNKAGWGGLAFLNNNQWTTKYYFAPGATKLTYDIQADPGVRVIITAFPGTIAKKDTLMGVTATTWVSKTISFTGTYPDNLVV